MKEAKPIALVMCNHGIPSRADFESLTKSIKKSLPDYRVLVAFQDKPDKDAATIQVFNGDLISDVQFDELKRIIEKAHNG